MATVFIDTATSHNCILLPLIESPIQNDLVTSSALASTQSMGIGNSSQYNSKENDSSLVACLSSVKHYNSYYSSLNLTDADGVTYFYPDICSMLVPELNGDVGGFGVGPFCPLGTIERFG